jgi:hypothetical protein
MPYGDILGRRRKSRQQPRAHQLEAQLLPARGPAQLDEATDGPLTFEFLGLVQLSDLGSGAPANLHQVWVGGGVALVTQRTPPRRPAFIADLLLRTLASRKLNHGAG